MKKQDETTHEAITAEIPAALLQQVVENAGSRKLTIGLVGNYEDTDETRFLLTPESCGMLISAGLGIKMESDAAIDIDFLNAAYADYGVEITSRDEALDCEVVLCYSMLRLKDIKKLRPDATLLCMSSESIFKKNVVHELLSRRITLGFLDRMYSHNDEYVFSNIIDEVDGRCAVFYAMQALSFSEGGKGVLLAGVAGLNPCEVLLIGQGQKVCTAARSAIAAGAQVFLMDNDVSTLQQARAFCGDRLITSIIHPRVLIRRVKSADVVILDECTRHFDIPDSLKSVAKESVYVLDFRKTAPSVIVPRTVAMALSNVMVNFLTEMVTKDGFEGMLSCTQGLQAGIITYKGKLTNKLVGTVVGLPSSDIHMMLAGAN